jgi:hypothetical protein
MRRIFACLLLFAVLLGACGKDEPPVESTEPTQGPSPGLSYYDGPPPWPRGTDQVERMQAVGITPLTAEGELVHYHAHLDVFYDGEEVKVPANIGVDVSRISPLHTHYDSGVIHVEANEDEDFTLGQFLGEWGVKAKDGCVADKCGDEVAVFVDGSIQDTPAPDLVIKGQTEIVLVLGTTRPDIPSSYDCKAEAPTDLCPTKK